MRYFILALGLYFASQGWVYADSFELSIFEKGTGVPLKRVEIKTDDQLFYSDSVGKVALRKDLNKDALILIYKAGFERLSMRADEIYNLKPAEIFLMPAQPDDTVIVVSGVKRPEVSRKVVSMEEARKVAPRGDPLQIVQLLPGVQTGGFGSQIIIRGSGPQDSQYFIDDWFVPYIFHSVGQISIVPPQVLNEIEFSSGGFGAQYGNATGGIIAARTSNTIPERDTAEFRLNVPLFSSLFYQTPIGKEQDEYVALSVRRSYLEFFLKMILENDPSNTTVTPYFGDTQALWHKNTEDGHWKALLFSSFDGLRLLTDFSASTSEDGRGSFFIKQAIYTLGIERQKKLSTNWRVKSSSQISEYTDIFEVVDIYFRSQQYRFRNKTEFTLRRGPRENTYIGTEWEYLRFKVSVYAPQPDLNDPFFDFEDAPRREATVHSYDYRGEFWVGHEIYKAPFHITPGARLYYDHMINQYSFDPRLSMRVEVSEDQALKFAMGQYSQLPSYRDASKDFGNPNLPWIKAHHYVLGLETKWNEKWNSDLQLFYKKRLNLVQSDPETNTNSDGSGYNYGFEAFVRRNLTARFFAWLAYTYSVNRDRASDQKTFYNSAYDQTHIINMTANYKFSAQWELGGRFRFNTGDTFNSIDGSVYNTNLDKYQPRRHPDAQPNNDRLPNYHELALFAGKNFLYDSWKMEMRFGLEFLALQPQAQGVQYNYDYTKKTYFTGVPPIPYFEIGGVF